MTPTASCRECPWSTSGDSLVEVSDAAERHERKEMHDVNVERVATDGGSLHANDAGGAVDHGDDVEVHGGDCPACGEPVDGMLTSHLRKDCPDWGGGHDPLESDRLRADGGESLCGRETCPHDAAITYSNADGALRTRCATHALTDTVQGVGPGRAETIVEEIGLERLVAICDDADGVHAPPALSRVDGLGPTTAARIAENVATSPLPEAVDGPPVETDGGTEPALYLTTLECHDGHRRTFAHEAPNVPIDQAPPWPDVTYCPECGEPYPGDLGVAEVEVANAERVDPELVTDGGSKYVKETGPGYVGVAAVSGGGVSIGVGIGPVDWAVGDPIWVIEESPGIALVDEEPAVPIATHSVADNSGSHGPTVNIAGRGLAPLDVSHGDDVRVYEREAGGLLLVPADPDPMLVTNGGQEQLDEEEPFGIVDLGIGDTLAVKYDTPRSPDEQSRSGEVAEIGAVEKEHAPTGTTEIVLSRRDEDDIILWPAWDEIRTDAAGALGEIVEVSRVNRRDDQAQLETDGGRETVEWFVVDEGRVTVVGGPYSRHTSAMGEARDRGDDYVAATRTALEVLEETAEAGLSWEIDPEDRPAVAGDDDAVATDGGLESTDNGEWSLEDTDLGESLLGRPEVRDASLHIGEDCEVVLVTFKTWAIPNGFASQYGLRLESAAVVDARSWWKRKINFGRSAWLEATFVYEDDGESGVCGRTGGEPVADGGFLQGDRVRVVENSESPKAGCEGEVVRQNGAHVVVDFDDGDQVGHYVGEIVLEEQARADGGLADVDDRAHVCEICDSCFDTVRELVDHPCDDDRDYRWVGQEGSADGE